ncbi:MAG TPA: ribonuclease P protein component [Verrucomicrobiae bacterium]|nr:ribonuclease P protein component [Verrucomicrobiae bacterium]
MAAERPSLHFPRTMRLKQRRDFAEIRQQGQRLVNGCLIANWTPLAPDCRSRVGVITSRRLGPAVVRSRARRLLRETFRLHQHDLREPVRVVLVARPSIVGKGLPDVERDFLSAMRRAKLLKASE